MLNSWGFELRETFPTATRTADDPGPLEDPEVLADRLAGDPRAPREPPDRLGTATGEVTHDAQSVRVSQGGE